MRIFLISIIALLLFHGCHPQYAETPGLLDQTGQVQVCSDTGTIYISVNCYDFITLGTLQFSNDGKYWYEVIPYIKGKTLYFQANQLYSEFCKDSNCSTINYKIDYLGTHSGYSD